MTKLEQHLNTLSLSMLQALSLEIFDKKQAATDRRELAELTKIGDDIDLVANQKILAQTVPCFIQVDDAHRIEVTAAGAYLPQHLVGSTWTVYGKGVLAKSFKSERAARAFLSRQAK